MDLAGVVETFVWNAATAPPRACKSRLQAVFRSHQCPKISRISQLIPQFCGVNCVEAQPARAMKEMIGLMSNTKWKKLLSHLAQAGVARHCTWKLLEWESSRNGFLPAVDCLTELGVGDCGAVLGGPFQYSEIEWLLIPDKAVRWPQAQPQHRYEPQDIRRVQAEIDSLGQYPYQITSVGLVVSGYAP